MCSGWCGAELYVAGILSRLIPGCLLPHQPPHIPKTVGKTLSKQETPFRSPVLNQLACVHPPPLQVLLRGCDEPCMPTSRSRGYSESSSSMATASSAE